MPKLPKLGCGFLIFYRLVGVTQKTTPPVGYNNDANDNPY